MFTYKTLENTNIEILHQTFLSAFSDYQVKIHLPFWKFQQMLQRKGYVSGISIGAFKNEKLVGFVLNGFRNWNGNLTVYDIGTGVIGEYRKHGITSTMLLNIRELIKEKKVDQYLLEVIQSNTSAIQLYKKQGFEIKRNFGCFQLDKKTGDIPQIAVNKNYRRKGIARSIVTDLLKNTESFRVGVINVNDEAKSTKEFLLELGFEYIIGQYEMILRL